MEIDCSLSFRTLYTWETEGEGRVGRARAERRTENLSLRGGWGIDLRAQELLRLVKAGYQTGHFPGILFTPFNNIKYPYCVKLTILILFFFIFKLHALHPPPVCVWEREIRGQLALLYLWWIQGIEFRLSYLCGNPLYPLNHLSWPRLGFLGKRHEGNFRGVDKWCWKSLLALRMPCIY